MSLKKTNFYSSNSYSAVEFPRYIRIWFYFHVVKKYKFIFVPLL